MNLSFKQYRAVDLFIMAVLLCGAEALITVAANRWFPWELYVLSPTVAIVCIVMMRWGGWAVIHAAAGGAAFCVVMGATAEQFAVYCVGNCFSLAALALFKALGKEKIRSKYYFTVLFTVTAFFGTQLGRWAVSLFFGGDVGGFVSFVITDLLSLLFAVVTVLIARRVDGLFEDQKSYLIRTENERKKQRLGKSEYPDNPDFDGGQDYGGRNF